MPLTDEQLTAIEQSRLHEARTHRATSPALEAVLHEPIPVLDHGFVRVIDYMGDDEAVVHGARVSYGRGTRKVSDDRGLIRYLMRHRHTTPFELATIKFHIRAPIFVARQWFRHRTASINEYSARYSVLEREFYTPAVEHVAVQSSANRQGRGEGADAALAHAVVERLREDAARCYDSYLWMLNDDGQGGEAEPGRGAIARELARANLPVGIYTQFYWQVNLWNLLHFLALRADSHAQYEIRAYAEAMLGLVARWVPVVHEAFDDYVMGAAQLSAQQLALVRAALAQPGALDPAGLGLSARETRELADMLPELASRLG